LLRDEGYQSSLAAATLQQLGFTRATDVDGGFRAWQRLLERDHSREIAPAPG